MDARFYNTVVGPKSKQVSAVAQRVLQSGKTDSTYN